MTCKYSNTDWLDVLYNSVRRTPGSVMDAARFLAERRGKSIHPESLRAKLRSHDDSISVEMALMLTEWMDEKAGGSEYSKDWMQAMAVEQGLAVDVIPPAPAGGWPDEVAALQSKVMQIAALAGKIAGTTAESLIDGRIDQSEKDALADLFRDARTMLHRAERNLYRA